MSANFLPQALFMVPRNSVQCQPKNPVFSAAISRHPSAEELVSRVSMRSHGFSLSERDKSCSTLNASLPTSFLSPFVWGSVSGDFSGLRIRSASLNTFSNSTCHGKRGVVTMPVVTHLLSYKAPDPQYDVDQNYSLNVSVSKAKRLR